MDNARSALGPDPLNSVALAMMATTAGSIAVNLIRLFTNSGVREVVEGHKNEGRQEKQLEWEAWNQRRMDAGEEGEPFDEPPPGRS